MTRTKSLVLWTLFGAYVVAGALALMIATPGGLGALGQSVDNLTFLPAKVLGMPWSLLLQIFDDGPVTALAVLGIAYGLNVGVGLMLVREMQD